MRNYDLMLVHLNMDVINFTVNNFASACSKVKTTYRLFFRQLRHGVEKYCCRTALQVVGQSIMTERVCTTRGIGV